MAAADKKSFRCAAPVEPLLPPVTRRGIIGWLRENLFSSPFNIALTVICAAFLVWVIPPLLRFFVFDAVWSADSREACLASPTNPDPGACWAYIRVWFSYFVYGFYPRPERWRVDILPRSLSASPGLHGCTRAAIPVRSISSSCCRSCPICCLAACR